LYNVRYWHLADVKKLPTISASGVKPDIVDH
jgi:hypothetical protein